MPEFIEKHKKVCIVLGAVLAVFLIAAYLCALFQPGIWYNDTFLSRCADGTFSGSDSDGSYRLSITETETGADISFSVDDLTRHYTVTEDTVGNRVEIYEDGGLMFRGSVETSGDYEYLVDENGDIANLDISVRFSNPRPEDLLPGKSTVYHWSQMKEYDIRGNFYMLLPMLMIGVFLGLDIAFPDLFFTLEHRRYVDGGEPSDFYRACQKFGRVAAVIGILVCIIMSLTVH